MIRLKLLPPLTRVVGEKEICVDLERAPLRVVLERAMADNGPLQGAMLDGAGRFSHEYSCLVNGERYNLSDAGDVVVATADDITLLLPISGGRTGSVQA
ncbi:MAG: hypothetical protein A2X52_10985 [Candidatus Rokubacteria bacterium GWC2_70_16]|nr:MAG: hypothetical protein A2X52_10985 [Candidatus Rokubacteria bacterium GWC2_70_16]OGL17941.1 MAG: hypothetical protein A3K12_17810 [Candidatus Rokubacteria bacterium RIFCSPLOWO2_12_FULL_71_19]